MDFVLPTVFLVLAVLNAYVIYQFFNGRASLRRLREEMRSAEKRIHHEMRRVEESTLDFHNKARGQMAYLSAETSRVASRANSLELKTLKADHKLSQVAADVHRFSAQNTSSFSAIAGEIEQANRRIELLEEMMGVRRPGEEAEAHVLRDGTVQFSLRKKKQA